MKIKKSLVFVFLLLLAVLLIGCNNSKDENELLKFENILFENKTFEYDEKLKKLEVTGLPTGASVEYETNEAVDVGTYNAKAIVSKKGYETLTLTATLTITEGNLKGITFDDEVFAYDVQLKNLK